MGSYATPAVSAVRLNSGHDMPLVGFGLWKVTNDTCADQVYHAIQAGYRLFDGACDYGNEAEAGQGVARAIADGLVTRADLFLVSKLWNSFHDKERVAPICKKQLEDWGIDYFDLYYIHFPISLAYVDPSTRYPPSWTDASGKITPGRAPLHETWAAMEALPALGYARSIGVSNYTGALLLDLLRYATIPPAALQIEHHPYLTQPGLLALAKRNNVAITAYSSLGPASFVELNMPRAVDCPPLLAHPTIAKIAAAHAKTPAQVLLRWAVQRGVAVIPKSNDPGRLAQNLDVVAWELGAGEVQSISGLDRGLRFNDPVNYGIEIPIYV